MTRRLPTSRLVKTGFVYAGLGALSLLWVFPYLWMVVTAFRVPAEALTATFPVHFTLANFAVALERTNTLEVFRNSGIVAAGAGLLALSLGSLAGYGFSRFEFRGKDTMLSLLLVLRSFPAIVIAMAFFILVSRTGLYDTHLALILINVVLMLPMAIWNMRTVFDGLPSDLEEAALVDGCTRLGAFLRISVPLGLPGFVATGAFLFLIGWNEFLFASTFISSSTKKLITTAIVENASQFGINVVTMIATSVLASLPLVIVFLLAQRYISSGLYGSVEE